MLDLGLHVSAHDWRRPKKPGSLLNSYKYAPPAPSPNHSIPKAREHLKSLHCCEVVMGNLLGREVMPSDLLCCEVVSGNLRGRLGRQISFVCEVVLGNLRGRICQQISFLCKIVMGDLRGRLCRQIFMAMPLNLECILTWWCVGPYVEYDSDVERSRTAEPPDLSRFVWVLFRGKGSSAAEPVV
ncbi:unnamed protein product [Microthlaspi erraticum]|uniref:Uncharacterized protein n=1 Tax=Microthlaspi erraticum TaxID=1685480 RepID=A0A6D2I077_9BRAS|nr:unnamed protein product [Microthlaspi erraticum]